MDTCYLTCLSLSQQLIEAAEARQWERLMQKQQQWQREAYRCIDILAEQAPTHPEALQHLNRLLADIEEKMQYLEQIMRQLQSEQQKDLNQLKQAASYLKS